MKIKRYKERTLEPLCTVRKRTVRETDDRMGSAKYRDVALFVKEAILDKSVQNRYT